MLDKIRKYGLKIITGYVDENDPKRKQNYFKSWQEISGEIDLNKAFEKLSNDWMSYDKVWKEEFEGHHLLMTSITNPGFYFKGYFFVSDFFFFFYCLIFFFLDGEEFLKIWRKKIQ